MSKAITISFRRGLQGAGSILDLHIPRYRLVLVPTSEFTYRVVDDQTAIAETWKTVGQDLAVAIASAKQTISILEGSTADTQIEKERESVGKA